MAKLTVSNGVAAMIGAGIGAVIGVLVERYNNRMNTPEETIQKLNASTLENKASIKELRKESEENEKILSEIKRTKKAYQDAIRPELEAGIRKELEDYISKADEVYEKARHENELASLKLELVDQKKNYDRLRNEELRKTIKEASKIYIDL